MPVKRLIRGLLCASALLLPVLGQAAQDKDLSIRYGKYHTSYSLKADATSVETHDWTMIVLKTQALDWAKRAHVSYSTSVQKVEVIAAYTLKADGRRIDVPKDNYQSSVNKGVGDGGPAYSDISSLSVVFPDLAVGDTVGFSYRIIQTEAIFPGHFSVRHQFGKDGAFDDVKVVVEFPKSLKIAYLSQEMSQKVTPLENGREQITWTWANPAPKVNQREDFSVMDPDQEVGVAISTFADYQSIARAYGVRALPKAQVTDAVKALASTIVGNKQDRHSQAKALYDWVATNITYGGNCVGVGAVVPRDLNVVIENRMGDCKDHATLLQGLLKAQGIESHQVLVNAGAVYGLPRIPVVSSVNHVINYLPEFKLYLDSTSDSTPFGSIPPALRGKPALHVDQWLADAKIPAPAMARNQNVKTVMTLADDGSMSGSVTTHFQGDSAISMRYWARHIGQQERDDLVKNMLRSMGLKGNGRVEMEDAKELTDSFQMTVIVDKAEKFIKWPGSGAFPIFPFVGGSPVSGFVGDEPGDKDEFESTCTNGMATEDYVITLPQGMKVLAIPDSTEISEGVQSYRASFRQAGNVIEAQRKVEDRTPTAVCSVDQLNAFRRFSAKVRDNLKDMVLYK